MLTVSIVAISWWDGAGTRTDKHLERIAGITLLVEFVTSIILGIKHISGTYFINKPFPVIILNEIFKLSDISFSRFILYIFI